MIHIFSNFDHIMSVLESINANSNEANVQQVSYEISLDHVIEKKLAIKLDNLSHILVTDSNDSIAIQIADRKNRLLNLLEAYKNRAFFSQGFYIADKDENNSLLH